MLERCHKDLHARNLQVTSISHNRFRADCVFKDDGVAARQRGIPDIPYSFEFSENENWDDLMERIRLFLEAEIRRLGF